MRLHRNDLMNSMNSMVGMHMIYPNLCMGGAYLCNSSISIYMHFIYDNTSSLLLFKQERLLCTGRPSVAIKVSTNIHR